MALPFTIFKATLQISDIDRQYYGEHQLTLARHPSETDERMMVRLTRAPPCSRVSSCRWTGTRPVSKKRAISRGYRPLPWRR